MGGLNGLPLGPMGKRALPSGVGSWLFPPQPTCHRYRHPLHTHQAMLPHGWRKLAQCISQGTRVGGRHARGWGWPG